MKKGKSVKLTGFKSFKVSYGTVDYKNLKSIYLNIQSWVEPKDFFDNSERIINYLIKKIKLTISENISSSLFESHFICDMDLRASGVMMGKKSFMNLECFFYTKSTFDFKSNLIKNEMKKIASKIISENFTDSKYFTFELSKKTSVKVIV
jgi:hypothetical protein